MAASVWKGHLTFGLVSVPVRLVTAARPVKISFHMLNPESGSRVKQRLYDPVADREVNRSELVKATELADGRTVYLTEEDLKSILPENSKTLSVQEFVKLEEVDPTYFDTSYYLLPDGEAGAKPYKLLVTALEAEQHAAVAKMIRSQREYLVLIRPSRGGLTLHTLFYTDEVKDVEGYGKLDVEVGEKELELARLFVQTLAAKFDASKYEDTYRQALGELLLAKAEGQTISAPATPVTPPSMDLMDALKASLGMAKETSQKAEASAKKSPASKPPQKESKEKKPAAKRKRKTS